MIKVDNKVLCENCFAETDRMPCPECGFGRPFCRAGSLALAFYGRRRQKNPESTFR